MSTTPTINWTSPIAFGGGSGSGGGVISGTTAIPTDATGADGQVYQLLNATGSVIALYSTRQTAFTRHKQMGFRIESSFFSEYVRFGSFIYPDDYDSKSTDRRH